MNYKGRRRLLSLLLCAALSVSAVPYIASAAEINTENDTDVINHTTDAEDYSEYSSEPYSESGSDAAAEPDEADSDKTETTQALETETESETENETETADEADETAADTQSAIEAFNALAAKKPLMALLYRTDSYRVRKSPSSDSSSVVTIKSGHTLYIKSVEITDSSVWYEVELGLNGFSYTGYIEAYYLAYSDEDWISWETNCLTKLFSENDTADISPYASGSDIDTSDIEAFPAFYQTQLTQLKELHPNWIFVPMDTGLDFYTAVENEMGDKSLIQNTTSNAANGWVGSLYGSGWYYATEDAVAYYMDPCNFLTESYIFQFEQLTFNSSYHTVSALESFLSGTFMNGTLSDDSENRSYAQAFYEIGESRSLSPIHLASRVYQEQGDGSSALISGTYSGYEGYYNYFNVSASGTTTKEIVESGLAYAKAQGWDTRYKSLAGGAATIGNNYILKGQDTLYLEKFNVDGSCHSLYSHQYMQNIQAPASEALSTKKMYANAGSLDSAFVFKIPVFENMPEDTHLESVTLDKSSLILQTSDSLTGAITDLDTEDSLTVTYSPSDTADEISISWSTSDSAVATVASTVSYTALVTAAGEGTALITVSASDATTSEVITASCEVTVIAPAAASDCAVSFMDSDYTTVLKSLEVSYGETVAEDDFPEISGSAGELFIGWFTGKNGTGTLFDSTTAVCSQELILYPYFEEQGKGFYVLPISDYTYTGSAIKPEPQVFNSILNSDGSYTLIELEKGTDYTVSYKNNKNVNTDAGTVPTVIIKGKGNYTGTEYAYFNITAKPLTDSDISTENITLAYTGKLQKKTPTIYRSGKKLSARKDFTVSYPDTSDGAYTNAGTYAITVEGSGNYCGTLTVYEKITSDILMSKVKVEKIPNQTYIASLVSSGSGMTPESITVTYGSRTLTEGEDYTVKYANHLSIGTATAYITAKSGSGFSGVKSVTYKIIGSSISKAQVSGVVSKAYTGNEEDVLQDNAALSLDGVTLKENTDYTVSYSNISKAGTAAITFKGINGYSGQLKKTYKITPLDITDSAITMTYSTQAAPDTLISINKLSQISSPYMKGSTCPNIQLYLNGAALTKGKDYTVKYSNNRQLTSSDLAENKLPSITVKGKGSFQGSLTGTWSITDGEFDTENKIQLSLKDVVYQNAPGKFKTTVTLTDANGAKLSAGKDYDKNVTYSYEEAVTVMTSDGTSTARGAGDLVGDSDIPDAGTSIRVTVKGIGAYEGNGNAAVSNTYRIVNADISKAKVSVSAKVYQNGDAVTLTSDDIVVTLNKEPLEYGTDYTIDSSSYTNNTKKGKASVVLKGTGTNYGGEKKITFTIGSKALVWWKNLL